MLLLVLPRRPSNKFGELVNSGDLFSGRGESGAAGSVGTVRSSDGLLGNENRKG